MLRRVEAKIVGPRSSDGHALIADTQGEIPLPIGSAGLLPLAA